MKKIILLAILMILAPVVHAKDGHITLLAVRETESGYEGSIADLYLELKEGSGRVFLETYPLTKIDTQISTRFAKEIACDFLDANCDNLDFFYAINADSAIIAGPSAGAAVTALTISLLKDIKLNETISITGTINSGGVIGPVGGLKAKIDAGAKGGIKKILIPQGERFVKEDSEKTINITISNLSVSFNESNSTLDLAEYGKEKGVTIIEVSDLNDVLYEFTGEKFRKADGNLTIDPSYEATMRSLAEQLCNRSKRLEHLFQKLKKANESEEEMLTEESALNLTEKGEAMFKDRIYYSSASFCFSANVKYSYLLLLAQNLTSEQIKEKIEATKKTIEGFDKKIKKDYKTITELEAYMVVKERLIEAKEYINQSLEELGSINALYSLAYAVERLYSADSWASFFGSKGKEFNLNEEVVKKSCINKIAEAEERYQYVMSFFPNYLESTKKDIDYAYADMGNGDYELCLFKASKAKAEADAVLSVLGVEEEQLGNLVSQKLDIVRRNIIEESSKGVFPILGYSYYEYANTLKESDSYSALVFSEYALELTNLDLYFKERGEKIKILEKKAYPQYYLILVFIAGILAGLAIGVKNRNRARKRKKR